MKAITDKQIMLQVRDGEVGKMAILFERHHVLLFNFLLRLTGSREVSEDLVQEVFYRMLKYRHTYRGQSKFVLWMYQIARNARIDYFRKQKKGVTRLETQDELVNPEPVAAECFEKNQEKMLLTRALKKLSEADREVLVLSRFQYLRYKEIAELLGCAEGTIKGRVHRAIKNLREIYLVLSGEKSC